MDSARPCAFGRWLIDARGQAGMTQRQLAEASGVHINTIKNLEVGETQRPQTQVCRKARASLEEVATCLEQADDGAESRNTGEQLRQRRAALGVPAKALAELAGVDRGRLAAIEDGASARVSTIGAIEAALDRHEDEKGHGPTADATTDPLVRIRVMSDHGLRVELEGPASTLAELEASAARPVRSVTGAHGGDPQ